MAELGDGYENLDLGFSSRLLGPYYQVMLPGNATGILGNATR
jgi:hypothetical protein